MTPDEMTTTLADVLRPHQIGFQNPTLAVCSCGRWAFQGQRTNGLDCHEAYRTAHLATVLAATVTEAQAGAWDEGYERRADAVASFLPKGKGVARHLTPPNPYRARADALVDRAERGQG